MVDYDTVRNTPLHQPLQDDWSYDKHSACNVLTYRIMPRDEYDERRHHRTKDDDDDDDDDGYAGSNFASASAGSVAQESLAEEDHRVGEAERKTVEEEDDDELYDRIVYQSPLSAYPASETRDRDDNNNGRRRRRRSRRAGESLLACVGAASELAAPTAPPRSPVVRAANKVLQRQPPRPPSPSPGPLVPDAVVEEEDGSSSSSSSSSASASRDLANSSLRRHSRMHVDDEGTPIDLVPFVPARGCSDASDFVVRAFAARLRAGIAVVKHARSPRTPSRPRVLYVHRDGRSLVWRRPEGAKTYPWPGASAPRLDLMDCLEVRHAWTPDPDAPDRTGTDVLRRKCDPECAFKSFSLVFPTRTVDLTSTTSDQCVLLMQGFSALCFRLHMAALAHLPKVKVRFDKGRNRTHAISNHDLNSSVHSSGNGNGGDVERIREMRQNDKDTSQVMTLGIGTMDDDATKHSAPATTAKPAGGTAFSPRPPAGAAPEEPRPDFMCGGCRPRARTTDGGVDDDEQDLVTRMLCGVEMISPFRRDDDDDDDDGRPEPHHDPRPGDAWGTKPTPKQDEDGNDASSSPSPPEKGEGDASTVESPRTVMCSVFDMFGFG